ncbi:MAG: hypothetical protein J0L55_07670 [Caulobacterales bacterium]|nr:hypothetical protein [Caulobacterales bacterium]MCA0373771.1 hypothetical protein [Pseudomonadota bacterium]
MKKRLMQSFLLIGLLSLSSCASMFDREQIQKNAINDCFKHGGTWDYENKFCKGAKPDQTYSRNEDEFKKQYPWAKWKKK